MSLKHPWKSQKDGFLESLEYLQGRKEGRITSFKTPWKKFNDATTDGLEWHGVTVIGGRPGSGKTLIKDQIIREGIRLNCTPDQYNRADFPFRVLEFQLEMLCKVSAIREYSSVLNKTYKYLCSADGKLSSEDLNRCYEHAKLRVKYPIDIVEDNCTVTEFFDIIYSYMNHHMKDGKYMNTIVTLDHSLLLKKDQHEKDKFETLYNLGEALTKLKRLFPIHFIILSQLNRNVDNPDRNEPGKYGNYILESDIFGSDALLQHADTLIGINRPGKNKIGVYGPDKYIIENEDILVFHFLKCRNGDNRICFFKSEFKSMKIHEIEPPPIADRKTRL